jgi:hypothetical protein
MRRFIFSLMACSLAGLAARPSPCDAGEKGPVLPGTPGYTRQHTREILQLRRAKNVREKAALFARFATHRAREIEAVKEDGPEGLTEGLLEAHGVLWKRGALVCIRRGRESGLDMRKAMETAGEESARQGRILRRLAETHRGKMRASLKESASIVEGFQHDLSVALGEEKARIEKKTQGLKRDLSTLGELLSRDLKLPVEETRDFRAALFESALDDHSFDVKSVSQACMLMGRKRLREDGKGAAALASETNRAVNRGMVREDCLAVVEQGLDRGKGPSGTSRILKAARTVVERGKKRESRGTSSATAKITKRLLKEDAPDRDIFKTLGLLARVRKAGMENEEMERTFREELGKEGGLSSEKLEERLERYRDRLMRRLEELDEAFRRTRERLEKLKEWLEKKHREED